MRVSRLSGPLLLGIATGCRSTLGVAGVSFGRRRRGAPRAVRAAQGRRGQVVAGGLVLGELVGDKLLSAPSRLQPQSLVPRLVLGAGGGAALAWRDGTSRSSAAAILLAAAAGRVRR